MEKIETINQYLQDNYGIDTESTNPMWRVVWSEDQKEKRETKFTDSGVELLHAEVRELPKYPWIDGAYVLEQLVIVPDVNVKELAGLKKSYEPIWVFIGNNGFPVPPTIKGCQMVIDCVRAAIGKTTLAKYKDNQPSISSAQELYELNKKSIDETYNDLFGDESGLGGSTINESGNAIIVPSNYRSH